MTVFGFKKLFKVHENTSPDESLAHRTEIPTLALPSETQTKPQGHHNHHHYMNNITCNNLFIIQFIPKEPK